MNDKMRSSVMGLILSLFTSPLPEVQKQPVAYLYNGVRLPNINTVWTGEVKETHPHAVVAKVLGRTCLLLTQVPCYIPSTDKVLMEGNSILYLVSYSAISDSEYWNYNGEATTRRFSGDELIWSSHDILHEDSTEVYFTGTDPIPVYE